MARAFWMRLCRRCRLSTEGSHYRSALSRRPRPPPQTGSGRGNLNRQQRCPVHQLDIVDADCRFCGKDCACRLDERARPRSPCAAISSTRRTARLNVSACARSLRVQIHVARAQRQPVRLAHDRTHDNLGRQAAGRRPCGGAPRPGQHLSGRRTPGRLPRR